MLNYIAAFIAGLLLVSTADILAMQRLTKKTKQKSAELLMQLMHKNTKKEKNPKNRLLGIEEREEEYNAPSKPSNTLLHDEAQSGNLTAIRMMVFDNADLNVLNSQGLTPVEIAYKHNHNELARYLIDTYNYDVNYKNRETGKTLLHDAAYKIDEEFISYLIGKKNAVYTLVDHNDLTPFDYVLKRDSLNQSTSDYHVIARLKEYFDDIESRRCIYEKMQRHNHVADKYKLKHRSKSVPNLRALYFTGKNK